MGFKTITERLGPGYKDRPSGAAWGRFGPSGAQCVGLSGVGEGLGMHWDSIKLRGRVGPSRAEWGWGGVGHAWGAIKSL